ncbi:hypothetical protein CSOJ01_13661 [Colletotrichum sojae]|uniref:Azaphilone pigments biosynthesis cluster protein L N-terminal domain-containing protein n=1 Tax=Colletotrichum sojae TaxID=2175907 RepID=A0A8H6MKB9_9PEZI|nr:hypothetical protein CSOJ01_13661 [Colletotrichum sojae]
MAEVFGVVISVLTVAEMAGKLGSSVLRLQRLWREVQDVPENINQLTRQLDLLRPILLDMESQHSDNDQTTTSLSIQYCHQAVDELERLAEDLQRQIVSAKKSLRTITKLKVTFKKDAMRGYHERLQLSMHMLSLAQQTHLL